MEYAKTTIYLSAYAKLPIDMPSGGMYKALDIGLIIDHEKEEIADASITLLTEETKRFLKSIMIGYQFGSGGIEPLLDEIRKRYFGSSQKAICVTLKLIFDKYSNWKKSNAI